MGSQERDTKKKSRTWVKRYSPKFMPEESDIKPSVEREKINFSYQG